MLKKKNIIYEYIFNFYNGIRKEFKIELDANTLNLIKTIEEPFPEWTKMESFQCSNCPLDKEKVSHCPLAVNVSEVIDFFSNSLSYEEAQVILQTEDRTYFKETALQGGISSILGIYMSTSGCPILAKLKPLVRYHLPFATVDETTFRITSMYLLGQYLKNIHGEETDWEMKGLIKIYDDIKKVNENFCRKISELRIQDASLNAVVILDTFGSFVSLSIDSNMLLNMKEWFSAYFE
ncbi:MAG TPA: hypothetical protein DHW82_04330 [Spirochaetia bacterium]|nr:MAG: hypothetical protein A2Y41_02085 [Spirochaetes bacterium GWB1_36_13]HCL56221.1 hypothetical protein [Spirochaetia bacterium]